ncbi:hypothetical protein CSB67_0392 [Enterobacter hormaechei]|nr:hypothetical protein CSB67_0392 [Enterobacter hormaechei]
MEPIPATGNWTRWVEKWKKRQEVPTMALSALRWTTGNK